MQFLGKPAEGILDKIKNILLGFFLFSWWIWVIDGFLKYLLTAQMYPKAEFFFSCVLAPLWEEVVFRVIPIHLAYKLGEDAVLPIIIFTSIIFGLGHGGPANILIQGVFGFILSLLYIKNNYSYWSVVLLHSMWNATCIYLIPKLA